MSIATLTGPNGLLTKANETKERVEQASTEEQIELAVSASIGIDGKINLQDLNNNLSFLENLLYNGSPISDTNEIESLPSLVKVDEIEVDITDNGKIYNIVKTPVEEFSTENTRYMDDYGNRITIPVGFKMIVDNSTNNAKNVTEGIVIEDKDGNQFVWVPVGNIKYSEDSNLQMTIPLSRYEFADGSGNYIDENNNILQNGTPINKGTLGFIPVGYYYNFLEDTEEGNNKHARDLDDFKSSVENDGGFYIARYEASVGKDGKPYSKISTGFPASSPDDVKTEGILWNFVTQSEASEASQKMYENNIYVVSDLVNSYAWDTTILFIQTFLTNNSDYSRKTSFNTDGLSNTGMNGDNQLNINDMASNALEWCTETHTLEERPCVIRGGAFDRIDCNAASRNHSTIEDREFNASFRTIIYIN